MRHFLLVLALVCGPARLGHPAATPEQHQKLVETCRWLAAQNLAYSQSWQPPGHPYVITMDCSNTIRYIVWKVFGLNLPRTASDQYVILRQKNKVRSVPTKPDGTVDADRLMASLRSGDLLFWVWWYIVPRDPPIRHVMIYLGRKKNGQAMIAGSSQRHDGERGGGVDVYAFDPNAPCGNAKNFFNFVTHRGRLVAYARPTAEPGWAGKSGSE
jgi:cell wall-associated NlpC family hydrolase